METMSLNDIVAIVAEIASGPDEARTFMKLFCSEICELSWFKGDYIYKCLDESAHPEISRWSDLLMSKEPDDPNVLFCAAMSKMNMGRYPEGIKLAKRALTKTNHRRSKLLKRAMVTMRQKYSPFRAYYKTFYSQEDYVKYAKRQEASER